MKVYGSDWYSSVTSPLFLADGISKPVSVYEAPHHTKAFNRPQLIDFWSRECCLFLIIVRRLKSVTLISCGQIAMQLHEFMNKDS